MLENSTQTFEIEQWKITDDLPNRIINVIASKANLKQSDDNLVIRDSIFGIDLTYQRVVVRNPTIPNDIVEFRYSLYTPLWAIRMHRSVKNSALPIQDSAFILWEGAGDKDRWLKDATLIKLSGV
jgi:hypothetical protein